MRNKTVQYLTTFGFADHKQLKEWPAKGTEEESWAEELRSNSMATKLSAPHGTFIGLTLRGYDELKKLIRPNPLA